MEMKPVMIGETVWVNGKKAILKFVNPDSILVAPIRAGKEQEWILVTRWDTSSKPDLPIERQGLL
jgi:hypothetical protein